MSPRRRRVLTPHASGKFFWARTLRLTPHASRLSLFLARNPGEKKRKKKKTRTNEKNHPKRQKQRVDSPPEDPSHALERVYRLLPVHDPHAFRVGLSASVSSLVEGESTSEQHLVVQVRPSRFKGASHTNAQQWRRCGRNRTKLRVSEMR